MNSIQAQKRNSNRTPYKPQQTRLNFKNKPKDLPNINQKFRQIVQKYPDLGSRFENFCEKRKNLNLQFLGDFQSSSPWSSNLPFFVYSEEGGDFLKNATKPMNNFNSGRLAVIEDFSKIQGQGSLASQKKIEFSSVSSENSRLVQKKTEFSYKIDESAVIQSEKKVQKLISNKKNKDFEFFSHLNLGKNNFVQNKIENENSLKKSGARAETSKKTGFVADSSLKKIKIKKSLTEKKVEPKNEKKLKKDMVKESEKFRRLYEIEYQTGETEEGLEIGLSDLISYNEESVHPVDEDGNIQYKYRVPQPVKDAGVKYSIGMVNAILGMFF